MVAVDGDGAWLVTTPRLPQTFTGSGDVTAAIFLATLLSTVDVPGALAHTAAVIYGLLVVTAASGRGAGCDHRQENWCIRTPPSNRYSPLTTDLSSRRVRSVAEPLYLRPGSACWPCPRIPLITYTPAARLPASGEHASRSHRGRNAVGQTTCWPRQPSGLQRDPMGVGTAPGHRPVELGEVYRVVLLHPSVNDRRLPWLRAMTAKNGQLSMFIHGKAIGGSCRWGSAGSTAVPSGPPAGYGRSQPGTPR